MNYLKKILTALLVPALLVACGQNQTADGEGPDQPDAATENKTAPPDQVSLTDDQYVMAGIETGKVEERNLNATVKVSGMVDVEPSSVVSVSAPFGGYLKSAGLLPGQSVRKGQVIATLENPEFIALQEQYLESSSKLTLLQQEFERQQLLRREEVNSAKTFQQVSSDLQVMKARLSALDAKLAMAGISRKGLDEGKVTGTARLYSPINGFVRTSNVNPGKYLNPTDVLFELVNRDEMHLALNVFEKDIDQVRIGQSVRFGLASEAVAERTATVFLIGQATAEDGSIPVHCHLAKAAGSGLLPGMYVKAWIEKKGGVGVALPTEAVVQSGGESYVFVQIGRTEAGYTYRMVPVKTGIQEGGLTEVTLPAALVGKDALFVTKGAYAVLSALLNAGEEE
ncbi:MAG: efflux RND transporter periplasmic adaptor subunit [Bacteroidetes bacterium]|nr:efflux RND transporter periplasmic adaptor subunit [Bacteroidota bacterium]